MASPTDRSDGAETREATRTFQRRAGEIPPARAFVRETVARWGLASRDSEVLNDLVLMASELFTNAVLHGAGDIDMRLTLTPDRLRLAVADDGTHPLPELLPPPPSDTITGRGLRIVDRLAAGWGSRRVPDGGTEVWVEIPRR